MSMKPLSRIASIVILATSLLAPFAAFADDNKPQIKVFTGRAGDGKGYCEEEAFVNAVTKAGKAGYFGCVKVASSVSVEPLFYGWLCKVVVTCNK